MAFPPRPHTSEMTFWSRYHPVSLATGPTDHWTKMKLGTNTKRQPYRVPSPWNSADLKMSWQHPGPHGPLTERPHHRLSALDLNNCYHHRAKEGFRYWLIERPKPTGFGRYGMGSFKTVLGVGNAPRT